MKTEQEIKDRIKDIDKAIRGLVNSGNVEEIDKLALKAETLEWVLNGK